MQFQYLCSLFVHTLHSAKARACRICPKLGAGAGTPRGDWPRRHAPFWKRSTAPILSSSKRRRVPTTHTKTSTSSGNNSSSKGILRRLACTAEVAVAVRGASLRFRSKAASPRGGGSGWTKRGRGLLPIGPNRLGTTTGHISKELLLANRCINVIVAFLMPAWLLLKRGCCYHFIV